MSYQINKLYSKLNNKQQKAIELLMECMVLEGMENLVPHKIFFMARHMHEKEYGFPYTLSYHNYVLETYLRNYKK